MASYSFKYHSNPEVPTAFDDFHGVDPRSFSQDDARGIDRRRLFEAEWIVIELHFRNDVILFEVSFEFATASDQFHGVDPRSVREDLSCKEIDEEFSVQFNTDVELESERFRLNGTSVSSDTLWTASKATRSKARSNGERILRRIMWKTRRGTTLNFCRCTKNDPCKTCN